jgi:hypothetical protein
VETEQHPKLVEAYRARNLPQAHTIRLALEQAGIRAEISGELLQGAVGDLPLGWPTAPRILVDEGQLAAARDIIEQADATPSHDNEEEPQEEVTRCLSCGRIMAENEWKCPVCGWSYAGESGV